MPSDQQSNLDSIYSLPINEFRDRILDSIDANQVTIITAETGAGKSTQVPQYLAEAGYNKIIVTQPRILAARNLSERVRQEYSWRSGRDNSNLVGYRTAHERDDSPDNVILYCTDGLQLVRELTGSGTSDRQILVLDEVHEWNENMEVLVAWAKKRCQEEPGFKLVLMSATIEANRLAAYFDTAPPITVPGRTFPVEQQRSADLLDTLKTYVKRRQSNILVFLPGKAEIEQIADALDGLGPDVPVIPLHSQLEPEAQQCAFGKYPKGKVILSTNIAQTSITIDDIDVVIDSGLERRTEVRNGVEGLFISEVSQTDCLQRAGRAGRTKPGIYTLARLGRLPCSPIDKRPAFGIPEIMRKHIDRLVLRLANISIDIEDLEFFHAPSNSTVKRAKRTLASLGALQNGHVTPIGQRMERFPVESSYGRMLVESEDYTDSVQSKLATVIAIQEVGGIVKNGPRYTGWRRFTRQSRSDLLAQYDVMLQIPSIPEADYEELGIIGKNIDKAIDVRERLRRDLSLPDTIDTPVSSDEEEALLKCIVAGQLHQLWVRDSTNEAMDVITKKRRELSSTTVAKNASLFVGTPFDLEVPTANGMDILHLITDITMINPQWLSELAPERFTLSKGSAYYEPRLGAVTERQRLKVAGKHLDVTGAPILDHTKANHNTFVRLYSQWLQQELDRQRLALRSINFTRIPVISIKQVESAVRNIVYDAVSTTELSKREQFALQRLTKLENWLDQDVVESLNRPSEWHRPNNSKNGHRRHGWRNERRRRRDR